MKKLKRFLSRNKVSSACTEITNSHCDSRYLWTYWVVSHGTP